MIKHFIALLSISLLVSACSVFSPIPSESSVSYLINLTPQPLTRKPSSRISLLVTQPEARAIYNTHEIAYTLQPYQIAYFVKSRWAETPSQMLQPLIIQVLQKTHYFHTVGSSSIMGEYDYTLNTQLIELKQDFIHLPARVHLVLHAQILKAHTHEISASKTFAIDEIIKQNNPYAGIVATNQAVSILLKQLAEFCLNSIK